MFYFLGEYIARDWRAQCVHDPSQEVASIKDKGRVYDRLEAWDDFDRLLDDPLEAIAIFHLLCQATPFFPFVLFVVHKRPFCIRALESTRLFFTQILTRHKTRESCVVVKPENATILLALINKQSSRFFLLSCQSTFLASLLNNSHVNKDRVDHQKLVHSIPFH